MSKEYIEREAVIKLSKDIKDNFAPLHRAVIDAFIYLINNNIPTADVAPVVHGEWVKEKWTQTDQHICSLCHSTVRVHPQSVQYKYCPYCGAKMRGG